MPKRFYIDTVGCQMNSLDSELVLAELVRRGYQPADSLKTADVILFNTCSVRAHAEDKIYSALGRLKHVKTHRPGTILVVMGCMAQREGENIFRRAPHVDLVVGPGRLAEIPQLLERIAGGEETIVAVSLDRSGNKSPDVLDSFRQYDPARDVAARRSPYQAMVRIMFGCDNFCTYCVVPGVRGPEQSRPWPRVVDEVKRLVDSGCLEVTLLGQTVNNYYSDVEGRDVRLPELLELLDAIDGLRRLRFVTNHPRSMTDAIIQAVADLPSCVPYFHVSAQSGSDRMLQRMNRRYTSGEYRDLLARIRAAVPDAAITSDFIVGFCGETEDEFQETVRLVEDARFKNSFIFKYSERSGTSAADRFEDDVPYDVKQRRNNDLLAVQNRISLQDSEQLVGTSPEILVEGPSKAARKRTKKVSGTFSAPEEPSTTHDDPRDAEAEFSDADAIEAPTDTSPDTIVQLTGRTVHDRILVFDGPLSLTGRILPVRIEKADAFTLFGRWEG